MKTIDERRADIAAARSKLYLKHAETIAARVAVADRVLADDLAKLNAQAERVEHLPDEAIVLVNNSTAQPPSVYHRTDDPCGYAAKRANFTEILEGDAAERHLRYCSACSGRSVGGPVGEGPAYVRLMSLPSRARKAKTVKAAPQPQAVVSSGESPNGKPWAVVRVQPSARRD